MQVSGMSAIVTGGASGLGAATAERLAANGAKVTIFDLNEELGSAHAKRIGGQFCKVNTISEDDVKAGLAAAEKAYGVARILVACAGGGVGGGKTVAKGEPYLMENFRKTIDMNIIGTFNTASKFAARVSKEAPVNEEERGVMIFTASIAGFEGQIGQVAYGTAKAGVIGMTLIIARDLADKGIRCCTIAPGPFATPPMLRARKEVMDSIIGQQPFPKRLGKPAEFAQLAQSIIENPMLNGHVFRIDGAVRFGPR